MQQTITRKIFGQAIRYELIIEASQASNQYDIKLSCLQPRLFQQLLGNSPALLKNQLLTLVRDAAYGFNRQVDFQEPVFIASSDKEMCVQARFSAR